MVFSSIPIQIYKHVYIVISIEFAQLHQQLSDGTVQQSSANEESTATVTHWDTPLLKKYMDHMDPFDPTDLANVIPLSSGKIV